MLSRPSFVIKQSFSRQFAPKRTKFWWGHDSIEEQESRIQAAEDKKVFKFDPSTTDLSEIQTKNTCMYAPAR